MKKNMKKLLLILLFFILVFPSNASADTFSGDYVLPYPSFMPGHKFYKVKEIYDSLIGLFMFGNFTKFSYHLKRADKYLVEAKTLYEYGQIDLGNKALAKYQLHMQVLPKLLSAAKTEGKNTSGKERLLKRATAKHQQVLSALRRTK